MKRIVLAVIAVILCITMLSACESAEKPEVFNESFLMTESSGAPDLLGYELLIAGEHREGVTEIAPVSGENALSDMLIKHYEDIETMLNITITPFQASDLSGNVSRSVAASLKYADIVDTLLATLYTLNAGGYLLPVNNVIPDEELHSGKYGAESMLTAMSVPRSWGSDTFGFYAAYWGIPTPKYQNAGYFNHNLLKNFAQPNPFELIENGQWTWQNFEAICDAVTGPGDDPSSPDDDTYGIAEDPAQRYVMTTALSSNGVKYVEYSEKEGKYVTDIGSQASLEAYDFIKKLYDKGSMKIISGSTSNGNIGLVIDYFMNGRSFFLCEYTYHGTTDRESMAYHDGFEFSWIPFPHGPSNEGGAWGATISGSDRYFGLPTGLNNEDMLEPILPRLFEPFEGLENYGWREIFSSGMFFNTESEEWFFTMFDNAVYDYDSVISSFYTETYLTDPIRGSRTVTAALESFSEIAQAEIDKNLNSFMN